MKRIFIFDYDGVIVDTMDIVMITVNNLLRRHGLKLVKTKRELANIYKHNFYTQIEKYGIKAEQIPEMLKDEKKELAKYQHKIKLFKGAKKMLKSLSKKGRVIIVTSNITKIVKDYLAMNNVEGVHEVLGADKGISKTEKIKMVKRKYPGCEYFYIGDTAGDIEEGRNAKVKTVAVTWGFHSVKILKNAKPDHIAKTPEGLQKILINVE